MRNSERKGIDLWKPLQLYGSLPERHIYSVTASFHIHSFYTL